MLALALRSTSVSFPGRALQRLQPLRPFSPAPIASRRISTTVRAMADEPKAVEAAVRGMFNGTTWATEVNGKPIYSEGSMFIRPSGNPIDIKEWGVFMQDMETEIVDVTEVVKTKIMGDVAYMTFRTREKFSYKGSATDDTATVTAILVKEGGSWLIDHVQRSSGTPASS